MKNKAVFWVLFLSVLSLGAEPVYSPSWGFRLDLPEEYEISGGDGRDQFSFSSSFGTFLDLAVYTDKKPVRDMAAEIEKKLSGRGTMHIFDYNGKETALMELRFPNPRQKNAYVTGWVLCMELEHPSKPLLAAIAYGPEKEELRSLHLSVLDSIEAGPGGRRLPGPVTECLYPRGGWQRYKLANSGESASFRENDAAAAQALVDREFAVMKFYVSSPRWEEAWKRFYRAVFKDSFDRLSGTAFMLERSWNNSVLGPSGGEIRAEEAERLGSRAEEARTAVARALEWVQGFRYERDLLGSDFVNLVSAAREGRGDCDSKAMLWAVILEHAGIPAGIMVSREFGHAMGMADLEGEGARFPMKDGNGRDIKWLTAETNAKVALGRIAENFSEITKWTGILFE